MGASDKPSRASYFVATYLQSSTRYKVYFVNPVVKEILGQPTYASLADLPESPDIVDVFRKHDDLPGVLDEAVAAGAKTLWLQLGSWHEDVAQDAEAAGLERRDGPLRQDRARTLPRRASPGRLRYGSYLLEAPGPGLATGPGNRPAGPKAQKCRAGI